MVKNLYFHFMKLKQFKNLILYKIQRFYITENLFKVMINY